MAEQQPQPPAAPPPAAPSTAQPVTLFGVAERLLAGAAVAGAAIYVLINALYVEFYDDFGVRPEDVGWDRLAVLGRAAWVALVGIAVVGLIGYAYATITARSRIRAFRQKQEAAASEFSNHMRGEEESQKAEEQSVHESMEASILELRNEARALRSLIRGRYFLGLASLVSAVLVLLGFYLFERQIEEEAAAVKRGEHVNGISLVVPFIDVRATRAKVTWLGDKDKPLELESQHLMYLGHGKEVAVFLACGRMTVVVPVNDVAFDLLAQEPVDRQRQQFAELCEAT